MPLIIPANSAVSGGFDVDNSCRFNDGSSDYLRWNDSPSGNRQKFTWSIWFKRGVLGTTQTLGAASYSSGDEGYFEINSSDQFEWDSTEGNNGNLITNRRFRDISAWSNVVVAVDTTQGTAANRMKVYVNGVQETSFATETYPDQNSSLYWNVGGTYYPYIGRRAGGNYFDGYMAEIVQINNAQLAADSFGEFDEDSGIWKPIDVSGLTFGDTGYYLNFQDSSALGNDVSGENHDWTSYNLTAVDQSTDTCTNNFATLNPLNYSSSSKTYAFGNTAITASASGSWNATLSNFAVSSGKWYTEYKITAVGSFSAIGVGYQPFNTNASAYLGSTFLVGEDTGSFGWRNNGARPQGGSNLSSWGTNDILMIAIDMDNQKLYFGKNGTWETSGNPESGATGTGSIGNLTAGEDYLFVICPRGGGTSVNFGSPSFAISSGNADGDGYGNFEYAVPSGYFSLNTKNLAEYG